MLKEDNHLLDFDIVSYKNEEYIIVTYSNIF
jgi:hypothetical protein